MTKTRWLAAVAAGTLMPIAAAAQTHDGMTMPMPHTKTKPPTPAKPKTKAAARRTTADATSRAARPPAAPSVASGGMQGMDDATPMQQADPAAGVGEHMKASAQAAAGEPATGGQAAGVGAMPGMDHAHRAMPAADGSMPAAMAGMDGMAGMTAMIGTGAYVQGSGTARLPAAEGMMRGRMIHAGRWMLMAHGYAWGVVTDQGGRRGERDAFVQSMAMLMGDTDLNDRLHLQLRGMMSLEPAMGARGYPNLFATGEVADGAPLVDRQHPHDLFMELSARVDYRLANGDSLFVYAAPIGEPALGPSAFMHRGSGRYLPVSPITHHWFDSTHITYGVVTAGYAASRFQLETSAFRGREPDEHRWDIEQPALDSWSVRGSWTPTEHWAVQVSHGRLKSPEEQHPGEDEARTTASVQYASGGLTTTFAYALKDRLPGAALSAWLGEASWEIDSHHVIFGRVENVANDELFPDEASPLHDTKFRVTKAEAGYAYRLRISGPLGVALGGTVAGYAKPAALKAAYGDPASWTLFAKFALGI